MKSNANFMLLRRTIVGFVLLGLVFATSMVNQTQAQDAEFTQFYANPLYLNPAFAGSSLCPRLTMNYRNQWPSLTGNYVTMSAGYDQFVPTISGGLGLLVTNDSEGQSTLQTTTVSGIYSFQRPINKRLSVSFGMQATYFQKALDWSKLTFGDQIDQRRGFIFQTQDEPRGGTVNNVDFSAGGLIFSKRFFVGGAVHHLNEPNESLVVGNSPLPMKFTGHAGAEIPIDKRKRYSDASVSPNILYRRQGEAEQFNLGVYVKKGPIVGGLWSRFNLSGGGESFIALVGIQTDVIRFGYSYDITITSLTPSSGGAHEVSMTIQFDCPPRRSKFRPMQCPSF